MTETIDHAGTEQESLVIESKEWRKELDAVLQKMHRPPTERRSRERSLSITKVQEAIMWLGMDLKDINDGVSCYKHGYDTSNAIVDSPSGVKL